ncbi:fungal specific transcription factor domain-containing protein [Aspergillus lucknowensis]|uniref:Zn(2)-C6 fungal-type domain-containing protein n=1 Tax=Aspergillus lucknowensis TaxID=176173 RepID=A0ABR4L9F1_9EURO
MRPTQLAPVACDNCRARRRRCDRLKPKCSSCSAQDTECVYRHASGPQPSQLVQELASVRERLEFLTPLVKQLPRDNAPAPSLAMPPQTTPSLTLRSSHLMQVLGLPSDLATLLYRLHNSPPRIGGYSASPSLPDALDTLDVTFHDQVQQWYPVLDRDFTLHFFEPNTSRSCISLLVASIALLGDDQSRLSYFDSALAHLPVVLQEHSIASIQCLILFSIYYASLVQPRQAHSYIQAARLKIESFMKGSSELHRLTHLYWTIYLIESEISSHLNLPAIGKSMRDRLKTLPLPLERDPWDNVPSRSPSAVSPASSTAYSPEDTRSAPSYFSSEMQLQLLLSGDSCTSDPASVLSQHPQSLEESQHRLGPSLGSIPHLGISPDTQGPPSHAGAGAVYRAKHHMYEVSIYWPVIYRIIVNGFAEPELLPHAPLFFESVTGFLDAALVALRVCPSKAWFLCASMYITAIAAIRATEVQCLRILPHPGLWKSIENSLDALRRLSEVSPSVQYLRDSLEGQLARAKIPNGI